MHTVKQVPGGVLSISKTASSCLQSPSTSFIPSPVSARTSPFCRQPAPLSATIKLKDPSSRGRKTTLTATRAPWGYACLKALVTSSFVISPNVTAVSAGSKTCPAATTIDGSFPRDQAASSSLQRPSR